MQNRTCPLTDDRGHALVPEDQRREPEKGSVVLVNGLHGSAWQRHFSDGLWHSTGNGGTCRWGMLLQQRGLVLVYDAEPRPVPTRSRSKA